MIEIESKIDQEKLFQKLKKTFYKGSLSIEIEPQDVSLMTWDWQQKFLDATVNSNLVKKYPTSRQFTRLFLKKIIGHLEGDQEVHDDFYSYLCLAMSYDTDDSYSYRHYLINNGSEIITIKETNKMVVNGTTGMRTWEAYPVNNHITLVNNRDSLKQCLDALVPKTVSDWGDDKLGKFIAAKNKAALMLADWALCHKEVFTNKTILELGSGVGFTGVTIVKMCQPRSIYLSDYHPDVIKAIRDNIRINNPQFEVMDIQDMTLFKGEGRTVGAMPLDWNSIEELPDDIVPDVVIGADIVYDPSILQPLCEVLKALFGRNKHLEVYIASVIRNEETFESFLKCLGNMNFAYQKLHLNESVFIEWDKTIEKCMLKITTS